MADEVLVSGLGDLTVSEILAQEVGLLLADRASFRNGAYLVDVGDVRGSGSATKKIGFAGLDGYDEMAAVAEGSPVSNTPLSDGSQTVSVARQALQYSESDLADLILPDGSVNVERLAASMVLSAEMRFTTMVCNVIDDFTQVVGTSGTSFTFTKLQQGIFYIERAPAPTADLVSILAPKGITDLQADLFGVVGVAQLLPATAEMVQAKGQGLQGRLLGVDLFKSSKAVTSGSDRKGGIWHRGAVLYGEGTPKPIKSPTFTIPAGTKLLIEFQRDASSALTKIVGNFYAGVARNTVTGNELLGVTFLHAA
jgi:hypothetical protein